MSCEYIPAVRFEDTFFCLQGTKIVVSQTAAPGSGEKLTDKLTCADGVWQGTIEGPSTFPVDPPPTFTDVDPVNWCVATVCPNVQKDNAACLSASNNCDETQVNSDGSTTTCKNGKTLYVQSTTPGAPKYAILDSLTCTDGKWVGTTEAHLPFVEASIIATCDAPCKEVMPTDASCRPLEDLLPSRNRTIREFITKRAWFNGDW
ncbi:hypothetical protein PENTCL1PPCAC_20427 [Pristionchus entomophagus]|uniref:Sushi domain-containing protein n=1 Tax=Pristionchus entomophagus TaxID=358040 RepID=A0AAV5TVY4_9BILA|nr:hypothetical protein PENTCL1PPCAC_20427 [Pristionchus entomophagus]